MRLSFSTRGWQDVSWEQNAADAEQMRFSGIEVYNVFAGEALTGRGGPFHKYNIVQTRRSLRERGLCVPCFDSSCDISDGREETIENIRAMLDIAADMQTKNVAVTAQRDDEAVIVYAL